MIKKFLILALVTILQFVCVAEAMANLEMERIIRNNEVQRKRCEGVADNIGKGSDDQIRSDIMQYRFCYSSFGYYTPFSKDLVDEMTRLAFLADTTKNPHEAQQNLVAYKSFVKRHIANLDVAKMAYTLSKQNPQFGNPVLYKKIVSFLQDAIIPAGRPKATTPESAYYVISYGEEDYVLSKIGGKVLKSQIYEVGIKFYNAHEIEDAKTGNVVTYFIDISIPIDAVKNREKIKKYQEDLNIGKF